jgi:hypothetical protein
MPSRNADPQRGLLAGPRDGLRRQRFGRAFGREIFVADVARARKNGDELIWFRPGNSRRSRESEGRISPEGTMLELSGNAELSVVDVETQEQEHLVLTAKDFHREKRSMLDDDVMSEDEEGEYVAYASALGYDFRVVAIPPNQLEVEEEAEEIRVEIIENNFEFVEPDDDEDEAED